MRSVALAEPLDEADVATTARALRRRLTEARTADQARTLERTRAEGARRRRATEERDLQLARTAIERLCAEAGTTAPQELVRIEAENERRRAPTGQLDRCDAELTMVATEGLEALRRDVSAVPALDLPARRERARQERARLAGVRQAKSEEVSAAEGDLAKVVGGDQAAEDEAAVQSSLASLHETSAEFLRVAFAAHLLQQATEQHRQRNQSPVPRRTSELLRRLTLGSVSRVEVDDEESVIKGVRDEHELVGVDGLSDGVRDQLFLALRLAALEQHLDRREPLPFVVDDILINFSDARARATLEVLAELARRTQVLLFTHHSRIAELAGAPAGQEVRVHRIGAAS